MQTTDHQQAARQVAHRLRDHGWQAFFVGGCVRDLLLSRHPKDFDIATDARPEQVVALFPHANLVGAHFGVVLVEPGVEVATFRSEAGYADGRHPDAVRFEHDPARDAARRDFTINALFMDPSSGEILDSVGGRSDLEHGIVRAIGDPFRRFEEDHLRLIRAIRFAARLGFTLDPATFDAIRTLAPAIHRVSVERIRDELVRILTEGAAPRGFELLHDSGLLHELLPEVEAMRGVEQPPEFHPEGDVWTHTMIMLRGLREPTPELALGVLLHDVGKPPTFRPASGPGTRIRFDGHVEAGVAIARRLLHHYRFSNDTIDQVVALVENHMRFMDVRRMKESTVKRFLRLPRFEEHLELHRLDCTSASGWLGNYEFMKARLVEWKPDELRPPRLLTGNDLIAAGYSPGPQMRSILAAVEDAQLEGSVRTIDEALAWVKARFETR